MNLKEIIFKIIEDKGYALDSEIAKLCKGEPNWSTIESYKREAGNFNHQKERFKEFEEHPETTIHKYRRSYFVSNEQILGENRSYRILKVYFEYLKGKGIKVT